MKSAQSLITKMRTKKILNLILKVPLSRNRRIEELERTERAHIISADPADVDNYFVYQIYSGS